MRPKLLKMTAFGPYAGEEIIDFEKLGEANMFLIYGPTGGGKTTILDAICYALYGETNGGERSGESMRSKFASDEIVTEIDLYFTLRQDEYRIIRRPQYERPAKRGTGTVKEASVAELYKKEEGDFKLVTSKYNEVAEKMTSILHFNVGQFRQVIMIAQNKFRELLTVSSKERQQILQDIFETGIYQNVEKKLEGLYSNSKERGREKQFTYEKLLSHIDPLEHGMLKDYITTKVLHNAPQVVGLLKEICLQKEEEEKVLYGLLEEAKEQLETYQKRLGEVTTKYNEVKEKESCEKKLALLLEQKKVFIELEKRINLGEKALRIVPVEEGLQEVSKERHLLEEMVKDSATFLATLEKKMEASKIIFEAMNKVPEEVEALKREYSILEKERPKVLALSGKLKEKKLLEKELLVKEEKYIDLERKLRDAKVQKERMEKSLEEKDDLQKKLAVELVRQKEVEAILERKAYRAARMKEREKLLENYQDINRPLKEKAIVLLSYKEEYENAFSMWLGGQAGEIAKTLEEGRPCPVCGSANHPKKAILSAAHMTREQLDCLEKRNKELEKEMRDLEAKQEVIKANGLQLKNIIEDYNKELEGKEEITLETKNQLDESIKERQQKMIYLESLQKKLESYASEIKETEIFKEKLAEEITGCKLKLSQLVAEIKGTEGDIPENLRTEIAFEGKLRELKETYIKQETEYKLKEETLIKLKEEFTKRDTILKEQIKRSDSVSLIYDEKEEQFKALLSNNGFKDYEDYKCNKLSVDILEQNKNDLADYKEQKVLLEKRIRDLEEKTKDFSMEELGKVKEEHNQLVEKNTALTMKKDKVHQYIKAHLAIGHELTKLYSEMEEILKKQRIIERISLLAKGKNKKGLSFERYIQSSIFDEVLHSANRKLKPMTNGRYELYRTIELTRANAQAGLDLGIMDYYSGEKRPVNTLSGGESFMAALALALGLSEVIQQFAGATPLDTLFIDEGFGSLDEEALELAIKTLLNIQDTGRLIGIISHVRELREQIPVGLEIIASSEGSKTIFRV